ncbi:MAG: NUDIX domain-containing protein [Balneolaceae bacterium]|nr:NUDIX domain-containing protein [Balneolaceae bacterium]
MKDSIYKNKLRVRTGAIIISNEWLLLVKQNAPTRKKPIWMPPGGGVEFGETTEKALVREVKEETGLVVTPERLLWVHEFLEKPFHAIEFYYECSISGGTLKLGADPEHNPDQQILMALKFVPFSELVSLDLYPDFIKQSCIDNGKLPEHVTHLNYIS